MKKMLKSVLTPSLALLSIVLVETSAAGSITVDGNLSDWGVNLTSPGDRLSYSFTQTSGPAIPTTYNTTPVTGTGTFGGVAFKYFIEDQNDSTGSYLGPHYGGQNYDAEFLAVGVDNGHLVIAISTGQRADNTPQDRTFAPGDIMIKTAAGDFAIEVGGGSISEGGSSAGDAGKTFTLDSNGYTTGETGTTVAKAGSVWTGNLTYVNSPIDTNVPTQLLSGDTNVGQALYQYSYPTNSQHAFIEVAVPLDFFGLTTIQSVRWAPACNNDIVMIENMDVEGAAPVPAPASMTLLLIGVVGLVAYQRRRQTLCSA